MSISFSFFSLHNKIESSTVTKALFFLRKRKVRDNRAQLDTRGSRLEWHCGTSLTGVATHMPKDWIADSLQVYNRLVISLF